MKVKGYTLIYIVVIMLILTILCGLLFEFLILEKRLSDSLEIQTQQCLDVESGINIWANSNNDITEAHYKTFYLNHEKYTDTVTVKTYPWGIYQIISAKAHYGKFSCDKHLMVGVELMYSKAALILLSSRNILNISEISVIKGNIHGDVSKIKYFSVPYSNKPRPKKNFIGNVVSQDPTIINIPYYHKLFDDLSNKEILPDIIPDTLENSFGDSTKMFLCKDKFVQKKSLSGNIIIVSKKSLFISKDNVLKDILIIAPEVTIESGFSGSLQVIASDVINVEEDCSLLYPSSLVLASDTTNSISKINISTNSTVSGSVIAFKNLANNQKDCIVKIETESTINGQVITNGFIDIQGAIYGQIICKKILVSNGSGTYENHLFDVTIDIDKLPKSFAGVKITNTNNKTKHIKWLW